MENQEREQQHGREKEHHAGDQSDACDTIDDPVRRGLCKVCRKPVLGELPFCRDHEPKVP
jgi:hypothetical protein